MVLVPGNRPQWHAPSQSHAVSTAISPRRSVAGAARYLCNRFLGVTNIILNHSCAAKLALEHLTKLGHSRIAFIKGQEFSSDTEVRWGAVLASAKKLGLEVNRSLTGQLEGESSSPQLGYEVTRKILASGQAFTALFAFNDISA